MLGRDLRLSVSRVTSVAGTRNGQRKAVLLHICLYHVGDTVTFLCWNYYHGIGIILWLPQTVKDESHHPLPRSSLSGCASKQPPRSTDAGQRKPADPKQDYIYRKNRLDVLVIYHLFYIQFCYSLCIGSLRHYFLSALWQEPLPQQPLAITTTGMGIQGAAVASAETFLEMQTGQLRPNGPS